MISQNYSRQQLIAMLKWQIEIGADEAVLDVLPGEKEMLKTVDFIADGSANLGTNQSLKMSSDEKTHKNIMSHLQNLQELAVALSSFDRSPLKRTANATCFADGNVDSRLMIIGEVPGKEEDRSGIPFAGMAGQFLDNIMASLGLDRDSTYLTNVLPWRPPGNRTPTIEETQELLPFLYRHVVLAKPELVLILGGLPAKFILNKNETFLKLRGIWHDVDYGDGVLRPTMASFHPNYLIQSPAQKKLAFNDWYTVYQRLKIEKS